VGKDMVEKILARHPRYQITDFNFQDNRVGCEYFHGYCMMGQSWIFKVIYKEVYELNDGEMGKEDCLITWLSSLYNVDIVQWYGMEAHLRHVGEHTADFEGEESKWVTVDEAPFNNNSKFVNLTRKI
jgi:hypothetical protein